MLRFFAAAALLSVSGCASIVSGSTQEIAISSNPSGATCDVTRRGQARLAQITTPASPVIQKTKYDLLVSCAKPGYETAVVTDRSGVEPWVFGNLQLGGIVGIVIDLSTGASNKYDSAVTVVLPPSILPSAGGPSTDPAQLRTSSAAMQRRPS